MMSEAREEALKRMIEEAKKWRLML